MLITQIRPYINYSIKGEHFMMIPFTWSQIIVNINESMMVKHDGIKGAKFEILILSTNTVVFYRMGRQDDLWGCETVWSNLELLYCHLWLHMATCDERNTRLFRIWIQNKLKENKKGSLEKMMRQWWMWDHDEECNKNDALMWFCQTVVWLDEWGMLKGRQTPTNCA